MSLDTVEKLAADLLSQADVMEPPVTSAQLAEIARLRDVRSIRERDGLGVDGVTYLQSSGGYAIDLRADAAHARRRFTLAHEIGHTYFLAGQHARSRPASEEGWCNNFARALLLPEAWMRALIAPGDLLSIDLMVAIARRFEVSLEAVVWRIASLRVSATICILAGGSVHELRVRRVFKGAYRHSTGVRAGDEVPRISPVFLATTTSSGRAWGPDRWLAAAIGKTQTSGPIDVVVDSLVLGRAPLGVLCAVQVSPPADYLASLDQRLPVLWPDLPRSF